MINIEAFNQNVDIYEQWFKNNNNILESEVIALKQILPTFKRGLEVGVGTGIFASLLGISEGIEPSVKMGQIALGRGIHVINAKAENIPVMDQTYDLVAMITVDCFLDDILKAFSEVRRILESNGYFIIAFIDKDTDLGQLYDEKKKSNIFYRNAKFHSSTEIITVLKNTGFEIIDKRQTIYSLDNIIHESKSGVGEGVFAIINAKKI